MTVGLAIRRLRERAGMTQTDLAGILGVAQQAVSNIESGATRLAGLESAAKIAAALGVTINDLLITEEEPEAPNAAAEAA